MDKCNESDDVESDIESFDTIPYYLPTEVVVHNKPDDCWVSYMTDVFNLTNLCTLWRDTEEIKPILANAGKDISHWFDHLRHDIRYYIHPITGASVPYCPHGPIPDVGNIMPVCDWRPLHRCPWWLDYKFRIGKITSNPRPIKILNVLTGQSAIIMVCEEDTINRIKHRYLLFNNNAMSYEFKFQGKILNINKTLTENNIIDERERYLNCGLPDDIYIPTIFCHYKENLIP
ncbi:hypothetical protein PV328_004413 [Microctonus aethiopoides]|uniref:Uncharacterized protein n=1 Tax=Microctonus aethiopoides TaxID=144406 RepID=A0AA39KLI8_9HYME|nr:hypothetical protein PV328_004413 [Microctonus aethiopoides]